MTTSTPLALQELRVSQIRPHPRNIRTHVGDLAELTESIRSQGILEPLLVAPGKTPTQFVLLAGHRRFAAAKAAGLKTVPAIVRTDLTGDAEQLEVMLVENLQRVNLSPIEEANGYQALLEFPGYTIKALAANTGRTQRTIKSRVAIAKLDSETKDRIHAGQISLGDAQILAEYIDDPASLHRLTRDVGTPSFAYAVRAAEHKRANDRADAVCRRHLTKLGVRILDPQAEADEALWDAAENLEELGTEFVEDPENPDLVVVPERHASCPGHAAVLPGSYFDPKSPLKEIDWVCTQPELHAFTSTPRSPSASASSSADPSPAVTAEDQAEVEAARARIATALQEARTHRRQWLRKAIDEFPLVVDAAATTYLSKQLTKQFTSSPHAVNLIADILSPESAPHDYDWEQIREKSTAMQTLQDRIIDAFADLDHDHQAAVLHIAHYSRDEYRLAHHAAWWPSGEYTSHSVTEWLGELTDVFQYGWTTVEEELLNRATETDADE